MKKKFLLVVMFTINFTVAQKLDSIIFVSEFEKNLFRTTINDSINNTDIFFEGLFAIDSIYDQKKVNDNKKKLNAFYTTLNSKKISRYNNRKKVKYLFNKVHDYFLRRYKDVSNFSQIFQDGVYNCVSATALYSQVFDKYNIPYNIKETPTHVFLIAFPKTHNIYVETTVPGKSGYYSPSENEIKTVVDQLIKNKLLTKEEVNSIGYNKSYFNYFFDKDFISKKNLIGLQYYNEAISFLINQEYVKAYKSLLKSEIFYDSKRIKFLKISLASMILSKSEFNTIESINNLISLINNLEYKIDYTKNDLNYYISNISLTNKDNIEFLVNSSLLYDKIKNVDVRNIFKENIYLLIIEGQIKSRKNLKEIVPFAREVYKINPKNSNLIYSFSWSVLNSFKYSTPNKNTLDKINVYANEFPFIKDDNSYKNFVLISYAYLTQKNYRNNKIKIGKQYFNKVKEIINNNTEDINYNQEAIGTAYWSVGAYYYKKNKLKLAKKVLEEGKKIAPDHENLNRVLKYVNEDLK
jgi:hypothetical protein